jgi:hypothetical protein
MGVFFGRFVALHIFAANTDSWQVADTLGRFLRSLLRQEGARLDLPDGEARCELAIGCLVISRPQGRITEFGVEYFGADVRTQRPIHGVLAVSYPLDDAIEAPCLSLCQKLIEELGRKLQLATV